MKVMLKEVVLSMPQLFEAKAFDAQSAVKFSAHFLIKPGSEAEQTIRDALVKEAQELWKDGAAAKLRAIKAAGKMWCLRDGESKVDKDGNVLSGYEGMRFVSAKNTIRPLLVDGNRGAIAESDGKLYPGAIVNALLDVRVNSKPSDQAYAYLLGVQFVRDGKRLAGGAVAAADDFDVIPTEAMQKATDSGGGASDLF